MKFKIERASTSCEDKLPCNGAKLVERASNGCIFEIELNTINDIIGLVNEVGKIVIHPEDGIVIYDDYLE